MLIDLEVDCYFCGGGGGLKLIFSRVEICRYETIFHIL